MEGAILAWKSINALYINTASLKKHQNNVLPASSLCRIGALALVDPEQPSSATAPVLHLQATV